MKRTRYPTALSLILLTFGPGIANAADTALGAVETFFEAMSTNDWDLAASVMLSDAVLYGYQIREGQVWLGRLTVAEYLEAMSARDDRLLERIWDV